LGLMTVLSAIFLGRAFCGWVCPFGTIHHAVGWLGRRGRSRSQRAAAGRYRKLFEIKYYLLVVVAAALLLGVQQAGLLDPIALLTRSLTTTLLPMADQVGRSVGADAYDRWAWFTQVHFVHGAWVIVFVFAGLVLANLWMPRFFCRVLCPLGAGLGLLSRFSLLRHRRTEEACTNCARCDAVCPTGAEPGGELRTSECIVCFNCSELCPTQAVRFLPVIADAPHEVPQPDLSRRRLLASAAFGLTLPLAAWLDPAQSRPARQLVRPPGALDEESFLDACVRCQLCARVCPTGVIQPASGEAGWAGLWTPMMDYKLGYCEYNCNACGDVCPTGAIRKLTLDEKHGNGTFAEDGPVRVGTAFVDRGRCLPWAMATPCIVCQEVCPVSPKAIYLEQVRLTDRSGRQVEIQRPRVDPERCIGCGICSNKCPVRNDPAIYVSGINASRDESSRLTL
ncbi:MAG: 4Fe-4S dicluster domain-containing protein, partial [Planctomycetota bacterium]